MPALPGLSQDSADPDRSRATVGLVNQDHGHFVLIADGARTPLPDPQSLLPSAPPFLSDDDLLLAAALGAMDQDALDALCLASLPPFALPALEPCLPLLALPPEAHLIEAGGAVATSLALPAGNLLTLTLLPYDHHSLTWAGFRKVVSPATPETTVWRLARHNLHEPVLVNRCFPGSGDAAHIARTLRQVLLRDVNPRLLDPFFLPGEIAALNEAARRGIENPGILSRIAAAATAITGGTARGVVTVTAASTHAALPVAHISLEPCGRALRHGVEQEQELAIMLEWLLGAWSPAGIEIVSDPAFENRVGMTRSEYRESAIHIEIPIEPASAHDLVAAAATTAELLVEIAADRPWESDRHFGRRTALDIQDAAAILTRLEARLT